LKDISASEVDEDDSDDRKLRRVKREGRETGLNGRKWDDKPSAKPDHKRSRREVA
jgi:hypothetical protein